MTRIQLRDTGFKVIPEGEYTFKITKVKYKEDFDKIEITCVTKDGEKVIEKFSIGTDGGANAFSYFAKSVTDDWDAKNIDSDDLVGLYFDATVEHDVQPNKNDPSKKVTFVHLQDRKANHDANFDTETGEVGETHKVENSKDLDLDDLLG